MAEYRPSVTKYSSKVQLWDNLSYCRVQAAIQSIRGWKLRSPLSTVTSGERRNTWEIPAFQAFCISCFNAWSWTFYAIMQDGEAPSICILLLLLFAFNELIEVHCAHHMISWNGWVVEASKIIKIHVLSRSRHFGGPRVGPKQFTSKWFGSISGSSILRVS